MDAEDSPHSAEIETAMLYQNPKYHRSLRSLNVLTVRFVKMLQQAEGGVLDLKDAVRFLAVGQKRRIYDITNVLEGVGLIVKVSKSVVKWKGTLPGEKAPEFTNRVMELKSELENLKQKEYALDQQRFWVEQSIRNTTEDCNNLTYVNHDDICNCFTPDHTLLAVRAPSGTQLDVPIPKAVQNSPAKYQIYLKSINGLIDVVLLNKRSVSAVPVVLPVPPPEEILRNAKPAIPTSDETESSITPDQASANITSPSTKSKWTAMEDMRRLVSLSCRNGELKKTDASRNISKELEDILKPTKELMKADLIKEILSSDVFSPLLRLSPPPSEREYVYNLDDSEGVSDLFDIPVLNV